MVRKYNERNNGEKPHKSGGKRLRCAGDPRKRDYCATVTFADVESGIVGYNTVASIASGQYVALGVQFENCAGGEIAVKDLLTVGTPTSSTSIGNSDQIWRWNTATATWTKYFSYKPRGGTARWVDSANTAVETTDTVPAGETVFFCRAGAATTLTLAGAVKEMSGASSVSVTSGQLAFMANPWPASVSIADFSANYSSGTPTSSTSIGNSDQIWRWNTATASWTKYFSYKPRGGTARWVVSTDTATETTDTIPAGEGFFFQRAGSAATISIAAPSAN